MMKVPKKPILVGTLLLGATMGLAGCSPDKDKPVYTAYGVPTPDIGQEATQEGKAVEDPMDVTTAEREENNT